MCDDELDELYSVKPDGFTALRRKLADAAKQGGDEAAAKRISAARKPTTAAWIVNALALRHKEVKQRLSDLGDRLRDAHAAMDGECIRKLSAQQRHTIDELVRAAFQTADVKNPSAAVREDVTDTLQAAIADSEVTAALGRLSKAERWSGFGGFGAAAPPAAGSRPATPRAKPKDKDDAHRQRDDLRAELAEAKQGRAAADDTLKKRQQELATARRRHDEASRSLRQAERDLDAANKAYDRAKQASHNAAASVQEAKARLRPRR